jgi:hypothetical protein
MTEGFLLGRVTLHFSAERKDDLREDLSAVALDADNNLWVASDEKAGVERLRPADRGVFADHQFFDLVNAFDLAAPDDAGEIDIEGMDVEGKALWVTGSHTSTRKKPKGKADREDLVRLSKVIRKPNRYVLGRIPLPGGAPDGTAARLPFTEYGNALTEALRADPHLGPFLSVPGPDGNSIQLASKENGFDIEGLAVRGDRVFLGLRGPVLSGWAALLIEIEPKDAGNGALALEPIGRGGRPYRKHLVDLDGMGVRDLCWSENDLLILGGPTLDLTGLQTLWRLRDAAGLDDDTITDGDDGDLTPLFDLPMVRGADKAEGIAVYKGLGEPGVMIVYDAPSSGRKPDGETLLGDVFRLPSP